MHSVIRKDCSLQLGWVKDGETLQDAFDLLDLGAADLNFVVRACHLETVSTLYVESVLVSSAKRNELEHDVDFSQNVSQQHQGYLLLGSLDGLV